MSFNCEWEDKMGEVDMCYMDGKYPVNYTCNLYKGNAFMLCVYETADEYTLKWFIDNKVHAQQLLGLRKGWTNTFSSFGIVEMRLNTEYKETAEFLKMLAESKTDITVKLYHKTPCDSCTHASPDDCPYFQHLQA